ncbi:MAG: dihydrodipicolinate reductase [Desulfobacteraceae bacterium]|nr:dihydrodipicolinate reductase [Desulfobacteraceae bacterium]
MINGLPGNVATTISRHASMEDRFAIIPYSLTGPEITARETVIKELPIRLITPDKREEMIGMLKKEFSGFISIDFSHPDAVNENAEFYCRHRLPFVMGTTGGRREELLRTVRESGNSAVIAPNMAKQIVGLQAMVAYAAENFPGLFTGYTLSITESHQQGKADTSGTAKAMIGSFNQMGIPFFPEEIAKIRDPQIQKGELGVPEDYLSGHGWHTYTIESKDKNVLFELKHNINGREIYAEGTLDAVLFLTRRIRKNSPGKVFSMIDVLMNTDG